MVIPPAIALQRRADTMAAFKTKLAVLERAAEGKRLDDLPGRLTPSSFCRWEAPECSVKRISSFTFYNDAYSKERERALVGIKKLLVRRREKLAKKTSKSLTESDYKQRAKDQKTRADSFANQYSEQMECNRRLLERVEQLEQKLARAVRELSKVQPLRSVSSKRRPQT